MGTAYPVLNCSFFYRRIDMKHFNDKNFGNRLQAAAQARQAMLKRAEKPAADDPQVLARKAEREAIAAARAARTRCSRWAGRAP